MPMREADAEGTMRDDLRHGKVRRVDVEVALDDLQVRRDVAEEVVGGRVGEVAEAEDLADFAGGEEFLELCGGEGEVRRGTGGGIGGRGRRGGGWGRADLGGDVLRVVGQSRSRGLRREWTVQVRGPG